MKAAATRAVRETLSGFIARGLVSRNAAHASGRYVKAMTVLDRLGRRLAMAQKKAAIAK